MEHQIRSTLDELWQATQAPDQHQRWDLRFSHISYLPRTSERDPQRFLYSTRLGFGLSIDGEGQTVGERNKDDKEYTSALAFWSDHPLSLIKRGSGYWKYIVTDEGITFLTRYDYDTRWGLLGRIFDVVVFRPLIGWATAWSFDSLRLWLEQGIDPRLSRRNSVGYMGVRSTLALTWIYQGLVPKLLFKDTGELDILRSAGLSSQVARVSLTLLGVGEIAFGLSFLVPRWRPPYRTNIGILAVLLGGALRGKKSIFVAPFNPASLTVTMVGLSICGLTSDSVSLPSAARCRRKPNAS